MIEVTDRARQQAAAELARHRDTLVQQWGDNYESHPGYQQAIVEVAGGRNARFVLADFDEGNQQAR